MSVYLSSGYFQGPNIDPGGSVIPFDWATVGNWFAKGTSTTGYPGTGDLAQLGLSSTNFGYEVGTSGAVTASELQFTFNNTSAPIAYSQDLVQEIIGDGIASSASLNLSSNGGASIAGNRSNDGYIVLAQGGSLQVAGTAARSVSIILGDYTNPYDGSTPTIVDQSGVNNNVISIGTPGQAGYNYVGSFASPIYGLTGSDKVTLSQLAYSANDTYTWTQGTGWPTDGTHGTLNSTFSTPGTLTIADGGTVVARLNIALPTGQTTPATAFHLVNDNGHLAITPAAANTTAANDQANLTASSLGLPRSPSFLAANPHTQ